MADSKKQACKYGDKCYQKNPIHLAKYLHPTNRTTTNKHHNNKTVPVDKPLENNDESTSSKHKRRPSGESSDPKRIRQSNSPTKSSDEEYAKVKEVSTSPSKNSRLLPTTTESQCSRRSEFKEMLSDPKVFIKQKFLVEMPNDFYKLWEFCKLQAKDDQKPEMVFSKLGLNLIGAYDVLAGKFNDSQKFEPGDYLRHSRFYYDPPEFQTVLQKDKSGLHFGYWRDCPSDVDNCFIASNDVNKGCEITIIADNIFSAIINFLDSKEAGFTIFNRTSAVAMKKSLQDYAAANNIPLDTFKNKIKARNSKVVSKTFHRAGLVVPVDSKTQVGYRELIETDENLKKILSLLDNNDKTIFIDVMEKLQPLLTAANIAVDECDFGNSIELGIDLFCNGAKILHGVLLQLLVNGYSMVNRPQFIAIIKAHLEKRNTGINLSII